MYKYLRAIHAPISETYVCPEGQLPRDIPFEFDNEMQVDPAFKAPSRHLQMPSQKAKGYPAHEESVLQTDSEICENYVRK
uniref:Uncharacterized protein n=1 Tax=Panagrolaimus davidi TaxID=227884 RepID=A0A914QRN1_9BILA